MLSKGVAICTYNRAKNVDKVISAVINTVSETTKIVICDDGSMDDTFETVRRYKDRVSYIWGANLGVGANKNRALFSLRNSDFLCILEDDLMPTVSGWFETYMNFCLKTNIHHICRVQTKFVPETVPDFASWCKTTLNLTPIYGPSPRGDLTFISHAVLRRVGAFHPEFKGVGHAHGQWSDRVAASGLIGHPNKWIDLKETSQTFVQIGDTEGGRWERSKDEIKKEVEANSELRKKLGIEPLYIPLLLP